MIINTQNAEGIIYLDKNFTSIRGIDSSGRFIYGLSFWANIPEVIANNAVVVRISVYAENPTVPTDMFQDVKTSQELINRLKNTRSRLNSAVRSAVANPLVVKHADISSCIDNGIANKIRRNPERVEELLARTRQITAVSTENIPSEVTGQIPDLITSRLNPSSINTLLSGNAVSERDTSISHAALKTMLEGVDPSSIGEASFPMGNYSSSIQGVRGNFNSFQNYGSRFSNSDASATRTRASNHGIEGTPGAHPGSPFPGSTRAYASTSASPGVNSWSEYLLSAFQHGPSANSIQSSLVSSWSSTQVVSRVVPIKQIYFNEEVLIPSGMISGNRDIHLLIELVNSSGDVLDSKHRVVNHVANLEDFLTPIYAPQLHAISTNAGRNVVWIKQIDRVATEIWLYRRLINTASYDISSEYILLKKIPITSLESYEYLVDLVNNSSTCIYRAIAVGPAGRISSPFSSSVVRPRRNSILNKSSIEELTHVSIFAQTQGSSVVLRVTNIPVGPAAIYVIAKDQSRKSSNSRVQNFTRVVGKEPSEQVHKINSDTRQIMMIDSDVQHGHIYEYVVVLIYPDGSEVKSHTTEVHEFFKETSDDSKIIINLRDLNVQIDDIGNSTVTFNIESTFTDVGMETIIGSLEAVGIDKNFTAEIQSDRNKLNDILAFLVQRQDNTTGETETFGVVSAGPFIDDANSRLGAGVSPIRPGRNYRYIVRALLRSAESIFDTVFSESIDLETSRKYKKKVSKFLNPFTLAQGTLPSTSQDFGTDLSSGIKPEDPFLQGRTGVESGIDVEIPTFDPAIISLIATRDGKTKSTITWSITGDYNMIDHFIVMASIHGIKSPIARVHNIPYHEKYRHVDYRIAGEPGTARYSVVPVFVDYRYGAEVSSNEITLESNAPTHISEN